MTTWEEEFTGRINGDGFTWALKWTLIVLMVIITCHLLSVLFRFIFGLYFSFAARCFSSSAKSSAGDAALRRSSSTSVPGIITDTDLKTLLENMKENSMDEVFETVVGKSNNLVSYKAKCCKPKDGGPLKYLSVTRFEDSDVEVLFNFYMDTEHRIEWDKTVIHHEQLQLDRDSGIEIGRTIKKFTFLTPREYILAWRLWQGTDGSFYCYNKESQHPLAPQNKKYVRVSFYRSGWRIRKVSGTNACEITMIHQEDAGLNVEMAKMAFAKGIWSYVNKMNDAFRRYSVGRQYRRYSSSGAIMHIQKVPDELELRNNIEPIKNDSGKLKTNARKLSRKPSHKMIANGLVLVGSLIVFSRGHPSFGAKVAMAYMLSKLRQRGNCASPKQADNIIT